MGSHSLQAVALTIFLLGSVAVAAGFALGGQIAVLALGLLLLAGSVFLFRKCRQVESSEGLRAKHMTFLGLLLTIAGFLLTLLSLGFTGAVGMRMAMTLAGLAISLTGIIGVLNKAMLKNVNWKR